jgi:hypothetical protein
MKKLLIISIIVIIITSLGIAVYAANNDATPTTTKDVTTNTCQVNCDDGCNCSQTGICTCEDCKCCSDGKCEKSNCGTASGCPKDKANTSTDNVPACCK